MAFAIVSSCISFLDIIFYSVAIAYFRTYRSCWYSGYPSYYSRSCSYKTNSTGVALSVMLLLCVLAEFVVSIVVAVYCCKLDCGCCDDSSSGVRVFYDYCVRSTLSGDVAESIHRKRIDAKSITKYLICIQLLTEAATMTNRNFRDHYYCLLVTGHSSPWAIYFFRGAFSKQGVAL